MYYVCVMYVCINYVCTNYVCIMYVCMLCYVTPRRLERCNYRDMEKSVGRGISVWLVN